MKVFLIAGLVIVGLLGWIVAATGTMRGNERRKRLTDEQVRRYRLAHWRGPRG